MRTDRVLKGRAAAAALLLLTSEQGLERLPRLQRDPGAGPGAPSLRAPSPGLGAEEPWAEEGTLGWPGTWQSCFGLLSCLR